MMETTFDRWAVKATRPDFTTRNGFQWAYPGSWTIDPDYTGKNLSDGICPTRAGDGLSVAKTVRGMASGGYSPSTVLVVGFNDEDVICEDSDKLRVVKAFTFDVWDGIALIGEYGDRAYLTGAYLYGAYLAGANLYGANLTGANLAGANLSGAYLYGARHDAYTRWPNGFDMTRLERP